MLTRGWTHAYALLLLSGCLQSTVTVCSDGRVCPAGTQCSPSLERCISDEQLIACVGLEEGGGCQAAGVIDGVCIDGTNDGSCVDCVCVDAVCGDGFRVASEICDGDDLGSLPACSDHGYYDGGNVLCDASCSYDPSPCSRSCGDGMLDVDHGEICDGAAPLQSCVDFGYDAGRTECIPAGCTPLFEHCRQLGWDPVVLADHSLAVISIAGDEAFVVGAKELPGSVETIVHLRSSGVWSTHATGLRIRPVSAWAAGNGVGYAVGIVVAGTGTTSRLLRFAANAASETTLPAAADAVWGTAVDDVWVFAGGSLMRGNGTTWTTTTVPNLVRATSVWGSGPSDVWVVSSSTSQRLLHFNGATWSEITVPFPPQAVWGAAPGDVFVAGSGGVVRRSGTGWTDLGLTRPVTRVAGTSATDVVAAINASAYHYDGVRWSQIGSGEDLVGFRDLAVGPTDVIALADSRAIRYSGGDWSAVTLAQTPSAPLFSIHGTSANDVFLVEDRVGIHRIKGLTATFSPLTGVIAVGGNATQVHAVGSDATGGSGGAWRLVGDAWQADTVVPASLRDVAVSASGVVFAVSGFAIYQRSGTQWNLVYDGDTTEILSIWCDATVDFCVAAGTGLYEWSGGDWSFASGTNNTLQQVWGSGPDDVWAVGVANLLYHRDAASWTLTAIPGDTRTVTAMGGSGPNDAFFAGDGFIYRHDGVRFSPVRVHTPDPFRSIWVSEDAVWLGTANNRAYRLERTQPW